ncbi:hypothetical protein CLV47_10345 [Antricoccus suffuscus]|uniref:Uncharacterized protein n=1 Tax=Antricoccus suffuscus TaxID=1629062 RepID=A0A2T1A304_9ACTN|nr:hypothetical protein [Antricoccus suffuscus]PRZ42991.1 hypothetical protein CLV47_10345 [Antricoccus suffuscus]
MNTAVLRGQKATAKAAPHYRVVADRVQAWGALLGVMLCAVQVALAALGFWGVEERPGNKEAGEAAFGPHAMNGTILQYLALALLILGIVTMVNWKVWAIPLVLAILLFAVQGLLVGLGFDVSKWFGALHALSGMVITAGFVWLTLDRFRHPLRH